MVRNALVVGNGGREHALVWKLSRSLDASKFYCAPGNPGTRSELGCENVPIDVSKGQNFDKLFNFTKEKEIGMILVGPEAPLYFGIVDYFNERGFNRIFGPTKDATKLEADKLFSFRFMRDAGIPQARGRECYSPEQIIRAIKLFESEGLESVLKSGGLTGGKGVVVPNSVEEALRDTELFFKTYGDCKEGGKGVLVSERLYGKEFSVKAICDGKRALTFMMAAQDHKRRDDNDKGPNTGGMGAYCPVPFVTPEVLKYVHENVMNRVVEEMAKIGTPFMGFLYAGMMMTKDGPKVLELNVRMGDPETQPMMMRLNNDLYHVVDYALEGKLDQVELYYNSGDACSVVLSTPGYPDSDEVKKHTGLEIRGLRNVEIMRGVKVFHAGTGFSNSSDEIIVNSGGRVLSVTALADGLSNARDQAYKACGKLYLVDANDQRTEFQRRNDILKGA